MTISIRKESSYSSTPDNIRNHNTWLLSSLSIWSINITTPEPVQDMPQIASILSHSSGCTVALNLIFHACTLSPTFPNSRSLLQQWKQYPARWEITIPTRIKKDTSREHSYSKKQPIFIVHLIIHFLLSGFVYHIADDIRAQCQYWSIMITQIMRSMIMNVRIPESQHCNLTLKNTICIIINRKSYCNARCAGTSREKPEEFQCWSDRAVLILSVHAVHFQVPKIQFLPRHY